MSRYRIVHCLILNDDKFPFTSDRCQLVFFHLLTTPLSSPFGLYKASLEALAAEKRWTPKAYQEGFQEVFRHGFAKYDERAQVIYIPRFLKYNPPNNPNVLKSWAPLFEEIPKSYLKDEFLQQFKGFVKGLGKAFTEAFAKAWPQPLAIQEQDQEQDQEQEYTPPPPPGGKPLRTKASKPPATDYSSGFQLAWEAYPAVRHERKVATFAIWTERGLEPRAPEIAEKLERLQRTLWAGRDKTYIPLPTTWFNDARYEDDLVPLEVAHEQEARSRLSDREYRNMQAGQRFLENHNAGHRPRTVPDGDAEALGDIQYRIE